MKHIFTLLLLVFSLLSFAPSFNVEAEVVRPAIPQPDFLPTPDPGANAEDTQDYILNESIPRAINLGLAVLGIAAFAGILISSIQMLTAYGNEDKINKAKTNLRYALMGFLVAILAYGIVSVVVSITLPNETDQSEETWLIPRAHALDEEALDLLLPNQQELIENQDAQGRVSLPGGDALGEVIPALITNILYLVTFLIFIAFMYGGTLMVIGRGNEENVTKAKNIVIYAAVAMAIMALGYALIYGIATLNLDEDSTTESDNIYVDTGDDND